MRDLQLEEIGIESKDVVDMDELLASQENSVDDGEAMPESEEEVVEEDDDDDDEEAEEISDEADEPDAEIENT